MPSKTINMHGKIYNLLDEKLRTEVQAKTKAQEIRDGGKVAFLNPQKRKDKETNYWIYVAEKTARRSSSRKTISSKILLEEYKKGSESFSKFITDLEQAQIIVTKELPINEEAKKETPKKPVNKKDSSKKVPSKKNGKKSNGKKIPNKNGKKTPKK